MPADNVRARGQELAELHIGGAEPVDGAGQPFLPVGAGFALGKQGGETVQRTGRTGQVFGWNGRNHAFAQDHPSGAQETQ